MIGDNPNDASERENPLIGNPIPEVAGTYFREWEFFITTYNPDGESYPTEDENPTVYYCKQLKNVTFVEMVGNPALEYEETSIRRYVRNLEESKYIERGSIIMAWPKGARWYTIDKTLGRAWRHYVRLNLDGSQEWWVNLIPEDTTGAEALKAGRIVEIGTDGVTLGTGDTIQSRDTNGDMLWRTHYPPTADDPPERNLIGGAFDASTNTAFAIRTTYNAEWNNLTPLNDVPEHNQNKYVTGAQRENRKIWLVKMNATTGAEIVDDNWPVELTAFAYFPLNPIESNPEAGYFDGEWFALACRRGIVVVSLLGRQVDRPPINAQISVTKRFNAATGAELPRDIRANAVGFDGFGPWLEVAVGDV